MYRSFVLYLLVSLVISRSTAEKPVQLLETNFTAFVDGQDSSNGVLLEFYANWCPTCQHFQPDYEKIAYYFNAEPRVQPSVAVARVDCATEHPLCSKFKIGRYPTLKYGLPAAFKPDSESKLEEFTGQRKPNDIIEWVGQQKGVQYNYDPNQEVQGERSSKAVAVIGTESGVTLTVAKEVDSRIWKRQQSWLSSMHWKPQSCSRGLRAGRHLQISRK